ncbi:MAG: pyruvate carboxyltransferase, partial [Opitutaceae bacterium]|nr:pyruvate carboxyltransferase [Opitutaceae bacterium]
GRWKNFIPGAMNIALGYFGKTPAPVDPEIQKLAAQKTGKDPITCRPADLLKPRMQTLRDELAANKLPSDDEHCVIYAMFPQQIKELYNPPAPPAAPRQPAAAQPAAPLAAGKSLTLSLTINGRPATATVEEL